MSEATGSPLPPPAIPPKKTNPWIIVILVIVVVCCGCFGVTGLIIGFWGPIKDAFGLATLLPALTILI